MEAINMQLKLLDFEKTKGSSYKLTFDYGKEKFESLASVHKGKVEYVNYDEKLQEILHRNVRDAKEMNSTIFKLHRQKSVNFPLMIGDF
jgi:outer membrane biogenesis lipoprotein LolB